MSPLIYPSLRPDPGDVAVTLENSKTKEFQMARTCILGSLLKVCAPRTDVVCELSVCVYQVLQSNKSEALPIRIFEVSDVVLQVSHTDILPLSFLISHLSFAPNKIHSSAVCGRSLSLH